MEASIDCSFDIRPSLLGNITHTFVEESIKKNALSTGNNESSKGYKYFSEKYIKDIKRKYSKPRPEVSVDRFIRLGTTPDMRDSLAFPFQSML